MDGTAIAAEIAAVETTLTAIGGAIVGLAVVAVGFKWAKGMVLS